MTNLGQVSTITGSRGRRASVATDKPADLPRVSSRGIMERQRSPQSSFVPDIDLDVENDDEGINCRPLLNRDHYGGSRKTLNHKIGRSPRNSLVPDDYYKASWNGARSPRNSLVPDIGLAPDTLYSSRHSLVFEAPLSPRNSLVPDLARNRSPRNSLVPPTGSKTSLISENGNIPLNRSPRHSLVPNSSRSPRGSITNMELVDRSSQRSLQGSIGSEYLNQSPRNSIIAYEMNRPTRGSIGVNDAPRRSITANDEDMRTIRRSIDPDTIDRTPRGSLGGLQERRLTKASLMAQDPRRASTDQDMNENRYSPTSRQKEVNSESAKSGGSIVHINLGYGPATFEDSRRESSSVSQFSGDESRRLFTSSTKVPETTTENKNVGVITYGSVVFQLKDANLEASNICDYVFRGMKVVCRTRVAIVCLVILSIVPLLMLIFGWSLFDACPEENNISIYMVIGGMSGMIFMVLVIYSLIRSRRLEILSVPANESQISLTKLIIIVLAFFLICWFVMGNYWILHIMWPRYKKVFHKPNNYCDKKLYLFSLVHLGVVYFTFGIVLLVATVLASFRILDCPLPERYR